MKENAKDDTEYIFQEENFNSYNEMNIFLSRKLAEAYKKDDVNKINELKELRERIVPYLQVERENEMITFWETLDKKFENAYDVPKLTMFGAAYQKYIIPGLIRCGAIPLDQMKDGHFYHGSYRNNTFGKWIQKENKFEIWRVKFGHWYTDKCNHFQDDDGYALFVPIREATKEEYENSRK